MEGRTFGQRVTFTIATALTTFHLGADLSVTVHTSPTGLAEALGIYALTMTSAVVCASNRRAVEPNETAGAVADVSTSFVILNTDTTALDAVWGAQGCVAVNTSPSFLAQAAGEFAVVVCLGVFGTVASTVVVALIGADFRLTVVTFESRITVTLFVEADTVLRAGLIADDIQTLETTESLGAFADRQAKGVTIALTSPVAVRRAAQTLSAVLAFPSRITLALAFNARTVVAAFTSSGFGATGTSEALMAEAAFLVDTFKHQGIVLAYAVSMGVAVVWAFLDLTFISHKSGIAVALLVVARAVA